MILTGPAYDLCMHTGDFPVVIHGLVLLIWILAKSILIPKYYLVPMSQKCFRRSQLKSQCEDILKDIFLCVKAIFVVSNVKQMA